MPSPSSLAATPSMAASGRHDRGRMALMLRDNGATICAAKPVVVPVVPATWSGNQGGLEIAAAGGADRRSAKNADAPLDQSREALLAVRPLHSPRGGPVDSYQIRLSIGASWSPFRRP